jgi:hypothetical protein
MAMKFDIDPAREFGEVILPPESQSRSPIERVNRLRDLLADFKPGDYLLPLGDPGLIATAALIAGQKSGQRLRILVWDRYERRYNEVHARP